MIWFFFSVVRNVTIIFIDLALTFVFQILDEWIHFQAALLDITMDPPKASEPFILHLRRESAPIRRHGGSVSFKSSYSGLINISRHSSSV